MTLVAERIHETLEQRGENYGDFAELCAFAQPFKELMRSSPNWGRLHKCDREAMELIATKIARILCGRAGRRDSWHDIAGYAVLAEERCE